MAEIIRGGLMAVDGGQMEAGRSLGLNYFDTMRFIVIPQAIKAILPALGNEFIILLKDTSLITVIGGKELLQDVYKRQVLFIIVVAIGGFFFFRKMTHKELFCSASVLVVLNIVFGLIAYKMQGMFSFYFAELTEWDSLISSLLFQVTQNVWISAVINWILPPYIFVLFGKKASNES